VKFLSFVVSKTNKKKGSQKTMGLKAEFYLKEKQKHKPKSSQGFVNCDLLLEVLFLLLSVSLSYFSLIYIHGCICLCFACSSTFQTIQFFIFRAFTSYNLSFTTKRIRVYKISLRSFSFG
jgi:hypothetical protein